MTEIILNDNFENTGAWKYYRDEIVICGKEKHAFRILAPIKIKEGNNYKLGYYAHCTKCNHLISRKQTLFVKYGCPVCCGNQCKWNINSIAITNPQSLSLFNNIEDAYLYTENSHKKVDFICPHCNHLLPQKTIKNVMRNGLYCPYCSDGISMGEKIMRAVLQLTATDFVAQKTFLWSEKYKYDYFLPQFNTIIEVHGEQHYPNGSSFTSIKKTAKPQWEIDTHKKQIALNNGIAQYIEINASTSLFDYISESIKSDVQLNQIINLSCVDWIECEKLASHSMVRICADMWNNLWSATDIRNKYGYGSSSINNWLTQAQKIGLCDDYNRIEANKRSGQKCIKTDTLECYWSFSHCASCNNLEYRTISSRCYHQRLGYDTFEHYVQQQNITNPHEFFIMHLV